MDMLPTACILQVVLGRLAGQTFLLPLSHDSVLQAMLHEAIKQLILAVQHSFVSGILLHSGQQGGSTKSLAQQVYRS